MASSAIKLSIFIILSISCAAVLCDQEDPSYVEFVKETISSRSIVMFSKTYCPFCKTAKQVFKELNAQPYVIELNKIGTTLVFTVDGDEIQDAMSEVVGRRTVPQVFVQGKHIGVSYAVASYKSGELAMLIGADPSGIDEL